MFFPVTAALEIMYFIKVSNDTDNLNFSQWLNIFEYCINSPLNKAFVSYVLGNMYFCQQPMLFPVYCYLFFSKVLYSLVWELLY